VFINTEIVRTTYNRISRLGNPHIYYRDKTIVVLECDCCKTVFKRELGKMDHDRLSNDYYHVCQNCDVKRFAQEKGVESKRIWDMPASSLKRIGRL
jgi:hypothetical protein